MNNDIQHYNDALTETEKNICELLEKTIRRHLSGSINKTDKQRLNERCIH